MYSMRVSNDRERRLIEASLAISITWNDNIAESDTIAKHDGWESRGSSLEVDYLVLHLKYIGGFIAAVPSQESHTRFPTTGNASLC